MFQASPEPQLKRLGIETIQAVAQIRQIGFAVTDEEFSLGIRGVGRVVTIGGEPVGALSVAVPKARFDEAMERRVTDLLGRTAGLLETA